MKISSKICTVWATLANILSDLYIFQTFTPSKVKFAYRSGNMKYQVPKTRPFLDCISKKEGIPPLVRWTCHLVSHDLTKVVLPSFQMKTGCVAP